VNDLVSDIGRHLVFRNLVARDRRALQPEQRLDGDFLEARVIRLGVRQRHGVLS